MVQGYTASAKPEKEPTTQRGQQGTLLRSLPWPRWKGGEMPCAGHWSHKLVLSLGSHSQLVSRSLSCWCLRSPTEANTNPLWKSSVSVWASGDCKIPTVRCSPISGMLECEKICNWAWLQEHLQACEAHRGTAWAALPIPPHWRAPGAQQQQWLPLSPLLSAYLVPAAGQGLLMHQFPLGSSTPVLSRTAPLL